jgi:hypothetical protein
MMRKLLVTIDVKSSIINPGINDLQLIIDFDWGVYETNDEMRKALLLEIKKSYEMWRYKMMYSTDDVSIDCIIKDWISVPMFRTYRRRYRRIKKDNEDETTTD